MADGDSRKTPPEVAVNAGKETEDVTKNTKLDLGEELEGNFLSNNRRSMFGQHFPNCLKAVLIPVLHTSSI